MTRDGTQRSRSFLYTALAAVLSANLGLDRVSFFENGVLSLNLPPSAQVVGARATRTTHPRVLNAFRDLLTLLLGRRFSVENEFLWETKEQVVRVITDAGCGPLIRHSTSCARIRLTSRRQPHCGVCSQCIDRRFAVLAAGATADDPADEYAVDLLTGARPEGVARTMLASYAELASKVKRMGKTEFYSSFGEAARALRHVNGSAEVAAERVYDLYSRHALSVTGVMDRATGQFAEQLRERSLPESCLLRMIHADVPLRHAVVAVEGGDRSRAYLFRKRGDVWVVRYPGADEFNLLPSRGADYLHELLSRPGECVSAVDLACRVARRDATPAIGTAGEQVDHEALRAFNARLGELRGDLDLARGNNDEAEVTRLEKEYEQLLEFVRPLLNHRGKSRRAADDRETVRKAVGNAVRRAIRHIGKYHPALAVHLARPNLQLGADLCYSPADHILWET
jgi:hypothetical protein